MNLRWFAHSVFGLREIALGLFGGVIGHNVLGCLFAWHVAEDDRMLQSARPDVRRKLGVLQLIRMTVAGTTKSTFVELPRRKLAYGLVLEI